jgi:hypothetical protein
MYNSAFEGFYDEGEGFEEQTSPSTEVVFDGLEQ